ncbi:MAG: DUF2259 domain-containing protein [Notoacmeibacter sp.]
MKTTIFAAFISLFFCSAFAGDASTLRILGFSNNGHVFAFEESGRQDGSGFPYVNRFYIDTNYDTFLPGTPVRVRLDDENQTLKNTRQQAKDQGEKAANITDEVLLENPGNLLAYNPTTEINENPNSLTFHNLAVAQSIEPSRTLTLTVTKEGPGQNCYGMTEKQARFALDLTASEKAERLHEDENVPAGRNCPTNYRIGGVVRFVPENGEAKLIVLVQVESIGFEGPDYRWIAVAQSDPAF